ncbi:MAG: PEP/pyruvate-binding domain-containing protein [Chloroflexota bacterium]
MSATLSRLGQAALGFLELIGLHEERRPQSEQLLSLFKLRYREFRALLSANNELLEIIADLEVLQRGDRPFGLSLLRGKAIAAYASTRRMVESLQTIAEGRYPGLEEALAALEPQLVALFQERENSHGDEWVLALDAVQRVDADRVGSKMANLGGLRAEAGLAAPDGFCVTTAACRYFVQATGLAQLIDERLGLAEPDDLEAAAAGLAGAVLAAPVPDDLAAAILAGYDALVQRLGEPPRLAVRSSSAHEDAEASFAGQYATVLNVEREGLLAAYRQVVASYFTPRAVFYRRHLGLDEDVDMGVGCVAMVDALAAGVAFSRDPVDSAGDQVVIHAVWGLSAALVDGDVDADVYLVERAARQPRVQVRLAHKQVELVSDPAGGLRELPVAEACQDAPCLEQDEARALAAHVQALEKHFGAPQDVEWVLDHQRRLLLLQARPMRLASTGEAPETPVPVEQEVLLEGGTIASPGVACGPAVHMRRGDDLSQFPAGAVLIARTSAPEFVQLMDRAAAIVTDVGSAIGHMALLAREFHVPAILATKTATQVIPPGAEITVDAVWGRVYRGQVEQLLARAPVLDAFMKGLPAYSTLESLAALVVPLNLTDHRAPEFAPEHCRTLHDIARFVHERSFAEMFGIGLLINHLPAQAVLLDVFLPIDLYLIDLGGGLNAPVGAKKVKRGAIKSYPLARLVEGMLHPGIPRYGPRAIDARGFAALVMRQALRDPHQDQTLQDPSYAICSDRYLNYTARVGYHFSALDCYCGQVAGKNYITFRFQGGAADPGRRARRARAIAEILRALGFRVDIKGDRVDARLTKRERDEIGHTLEQLGRLLQFSRQLDIAMGSDASVPTLRDAFLAGNYALDPDWPR